MKGNDLETIIMHIARSNHTTVQHVRKEMEAAMELAMNNPDPSIQAKWARIPRKGKKPTLEEFILYVAESISN